MSEFVYGRHAVRHLVRAGRRPLVRLYLTKGLDKEESELLGQVRGKKVPVSIVEPDFFSKRFGSQATHQGIAAETSAYPYVPLDELLDLPLLLLLDEIQDPQNLGALCRSAHLFGAEGVVIAETGAAPIGPGTCRAAVGSVEYLRIARVSSLAKAIERLKGSRFWVYGADAGAERTLDQETFPEKVALVLGSEGKGLRRLVRERCDFLIRIPVARSEIDSLNVSVSGGIFLYEIFRRKNEKSS